MKRQSRGLIYPTIIFTKADERQTEANETIKQ